MEGLANKDVVLTPRAKKK